MPDMNISKEKIVLHYKPDNFARIITIGISALALALTVIFLKNQDVTFFGVFIFLILSIVLLLNSKEIFVEIENKRIAIQKSGVLGLNIFPYNLNCEISNRHEFVLNRRIYRGRDVFYISFDTPDWEKIPITEEIKELDEAMKVYDALKNNSKSDAKFIFGK